MDWHHVAAVRDGSTKGNLYVDGGLENTVVKTFSTDFSSATAELNIGWLSDKPELYLKEI